MKDFLIVVLEIATCLVALVGVAFVLLVAALAWVLVWRPMRPAIIVGVDDLDD